MVLNLEALKNKYNMNVKNIIHVGGHFGQETQTYKQLFPNCNVDIFEPHPDTFKILKQNTANISGITCYNIALGSEKIKKILYTEQANSGQSNSLLKPKYHVNQYPNIVFNNTVEVEVDLLDNFQFSENYNFLSMDVQGYELEVLKGSRNTLKYIDYIMTEINNTELYENCCMVDKLDDFLSGFGFSRMETDWMGGTWGDALYIKQ